MLATARQCLKINVVMCAALLMTFLLFFMMQFLIQVDDNFRQETFVTRIIDATMPEIELIVYEDIDRPEPIVDRELEEVPPQSRESDIGPLPGINYTPLDVSIDEPEFQGLAVSDSAMIPVLRTAPAYPSRPLQRRIEGFVLVTFTVDELGRVQNPTVTYAEPEGYFERAALQTIAKWKYAPRIQNGKPVAVHGVQQRIVFEIAD